MARVVVDVMPKAEILDPQGQAIVGALGRLGFSGISDVRQGKRFELDLDGDVDDVTLERIAAGCCGQHRDRGLHRQPGRLVTARIGVITFPGTLDDVDATRAVRLAGAEPVELWHADGRPAGGGRSRRPRRLLLWRLTACRRHRTLRADDGCRRPGGDPWDPDPGDLQRFQVLCEAGLLPVRSPATSVCTSSAVTSGSRWCPRTPHGAAASSRAPRSSSRSSRGRPLRRLRRGARRARGRGPRGVPVRGDNPNGSLNAIAGIATRRQADRRSHAAPRARDRTAHRSQRRRTRVVLLRARRRSRHRLTVIATTPTPAGCARSSTRPRRRSTSARPWPTRCARRAGPNSWRPIPVRGRRRGIRRTVLRRPRRIGDRMGRAGRRLVRVPHRRRPHRQSEPPGEAASRVRLRRVGDGGPRAVRRGVAELVLDRDLGVSGRLAVRGAHGIRQVVVRIDEPVLRVPQLAIPTCPRTARVCPSTRSDMSTRSGGSPVGWASSRPSPGAPTSLPGTYSGGNS